MLAFQLLVVIVALVGGIWPALFAAVLSGLTLDFLFVAPQFTVAISDPLHLWALFLYVVIAILVSYIVDQAARRARVAQRATAEAELLASVAGSVLRGQSAVPALVSRAREALGSAGVRLVDADGTVIATDGEPVRDGASPRCPSATSRTRARSSSCTVPRCTAPSDGSSMSSSPSSTRRSSAPISPRPREKQARSSRWIRCAPRCSRR